MRWYVGRPRSVLNVRMEQHIFEVDEKDPTSGTRHLVARTVTSHVSVKRTLQEQQLYPCHIQSV
jgi:hypothetical protein